MYDQLDDLVPKSQVLWSSFNLKFDYAIPTSRFRDYGYLTNRYRKTWEDQPSQSGSDHAQFVSLALKAVFCNVSGLMAVTLSNAFHERLPHMIELQKSIQLLSAGFFIFR